LTLDRCLVRGLTLPRDSLYRKRLYLACIPNLFKKFPMTLSGARIAIENPRANKVFVHGRNRRIPSSL